MTPKQFRRYHAHARARRRFDTARFRSPTWADGRKALVTPLQDGSYILYEGRDEYDTRDAVVLIREIHGERTIRLGEGLGAVEMWERRTVVYFLDELGLDILLEDD